MPTQPIVNSTETTSQPLGHKVQFEYKFKSFPPQFLCDVDNAKHTKHVFLPDKDKMYTVLAPSSNNAKSWWVEAQKTWFAEERIYQHDILQPPICISTPGLQIKNFHFDFCNLRCVFWMNNYLLRLKRMLMRIWRLGPHFEVKEEMHQPQVKSSHGRNSVR